MSDLLRDEDIEYISYLMSPDWMIPRARAYGLEEASVLYRFHNTLADDLFEDSRFLSVIGARSASKEARSLIKKYLTYVRWRDKKSARDLKLAQSLRRAGYVGSFQPVYPLENLTPWRKTACLFWPNGDGRMTGTCRVEVGDVFQPLVDCAVIKAISECVVKFPTINRAYLQGRLWRRTTGHVMVHLEPAREQIRSIIVDASGMSFDKLGDHLRRAIRSMVKAEKHELSFFVDKLLEKWIPVGFITSPAAVMISCVGSKGGIVEGSAPLLTNINGIGLSIVVGKVVNGIVVLESEGDHRMYDAQQMSLLWEYVSKRVPELLEDKR
jgi:hypothetical protein